jgi:hypothetical protein
VLISIKREFEADTKEGEPLQHARGPFKRRYGTIWVDNENGVFQFDVDRAWMTFSYFREVLYKFRPLNNEVLCRLAKTSYNSSFDSKHDRDPLLRTNESNIRQIGCATIATS